jgi:hypothetical protein
MQASRTFQFCLRTSPGYQATFLTALANCRSGISAAEDLCTAKASTTMPILARSRVTNVLVYALDVDSAQ